MGRELRRRRTIVQIAPLVDVVFLLLLFFLLTSHLGQEEQIWVRLPESRSAVGAQPDAPPTVTVRRDGAIFWMGAETDLASLRAVAGALRTSGRADALRIRADREVPIGLLVQVLDEIRLGGVRNLSIATERR